MNSDAVKACHCEERVAERSEFKSQRLPGAIAQQNTRRGNLPVQSYVTNVLKQTQNACFEPSEISDKHTFYREIATSAYGLLAMTW